MPRTPPFHRRIPGPDEFLTTKLFKVGGPEVPQFDDRQNSPALSLNGTERSFSPLPNNVKLFTIIDESIIYALNPTTGLFSIKAPSIFIPLVFTSSAAIPSPGVFASMPPVPLIIKFVKTAFIGRLEN